MNGCSLDVARRLRLEPCTGLAWNTEKVNGPCHSFSRSFKSGLTYEHHELSQDCYLQSQDSSTHQALLFHLVLILFSFTLISFMPISHCYSYSKLTVLARKILSVPAFNAASERAFSAAGQTITGRRTSLKPDTPWTVFFFLHSNLA